MRTLIARSHGEFVAIELAEGDGAGPIEAFDHGGVERADVIGQHFRAGRGAPALRDENVLVRDRNAGQGTGVAVGQTFIGRAGLLPGQFRIDMQESVQVAGRDAVEKQR